MKNILKTCAFISTFGLVAPTSAAIITYDNLADWTSAVEGSTIINDGFNKNIAPVGNAALTFESGVISTNRGGAPWLAGDNGILGDYRNSIDSNGKSASTSITWDFPTDIIGFGIDISNEMYGNLFVSLNDGSGSTNLNLLDIIAGNTGFAGFVGTGSFNQVVFKTANYSYEQLSIDNLVFAQADDVKDVSAPASMAILSLGLLSLGFSRYRNT